MEKFQTFEELLHSGFLASCKADLKKAKSNRILKSTRIEQVIYNDLRSEVLADIEARGKEKLKTFDSLIHDVFQSIYGLKPRYVEESDLSPLAKKFNRNILDTLMADEHYQAVKRVCEGKELPAMNAAEEFSGQLLENLDRLMESAVGGKGKADTLEKLKQDQESLLQQITQLMEKREAVLDQCQ